MFLSIFEFFLMVIPVLVNVAFLTLLERKMLGLSQSRKGPNKVGQVGLLQPFADAVKLFMKETGLMLNSFYLMYMLAPVLSLSIILTMWSFLPSYYSTLNSELFILILMFFFGLGVYPLFLAGWASNSNYALLGAIRGVAQSVSYEVSLAIILFGLASMLMMSSNTSFLSKAPWSLLLSFPALLLWFVSCVAETNRTPFDFSEGESELVSGFNIEYGSGGFTLIFMAEYCAILTLSGLSALLSSNCSPLKVEGIILTIGFAFVWIWLRSTFPRYRYDKLMGLTWMIFLPQTLIFFSFFLIISFL